MAALESPTKHVYCGVHLFSVTSSSARNRGHVPPRSLTGKVTTRAHLASLAPFGRNAAHIIRGNLHRDVVLTFDNWRSISGAVRRGFWRHRGPKPNCPPPPRQESGVKWDHLRIVLTVSADRLVRKCICKMHHSATRFKSSSPHKLNPRTHCRHAHMKPLFLLSASNRIWQDIEAQRHRKKEFGR
jgi:hypothetical protein